MMPACYLYHPREIPICISPDLPSPTDQLPLCGGGLRCDSDIFVAPRTPVNLTVSLPELDIVASGLVVWCQRLGERFLLSIGFTDPQTLFRIRMIEQACEIECYRRRQRRFGRRLTDQQAAREWIKLHAADFPDLIRAGCNSYSA